MALWGTQICNVAPANMMVCMDPFVKESMVIGSVPTPANQNKKSHSLIALLPLTQPHYTAMACAKHHLSQSPLDLYNNHLLHPPPAIFPPNLRPSPHQPLIPIPPSCVPSAALLFLPTMRPLISPTQLLLQWPPLPPFPVTVWTYLSNQAPPLALSAYNLINIPITLSEPTAGTSQDMLPTKLSDGRLQPCTKPKPRKKWMRATGKENADPVSNVTSPPPAQKGIGKRQWHLQDEPNTLSDHCKPNKRSKI